MGAEDTIVTTSSLSLRSGFLPVIAMAIVACYVEPADSDVRKRGNAH